MANITPRKNKKGEIISYRIRVARGYDSEGKQLNPYEMTWKPEPGMTAKRIEKEVQRQATLFEEQCKQGIPSEKLIKLTCSKLTAIRYSDLMLREIRIISARVRLMMHLNISATC